jgi:adenosylcobinamide amidohydrolase
VRVELRWRKEAAHEGETPDRLAMALWRPGPGWTMISSGVLGGGLGPREWVLNAQVPGRYSRMDPAAHLAEIAAGLGLDGPGVGLLTAAQVTDLVEAEDEGVRVAATVGLRVPTWAAVKPGTEDPELAPLELAPLELAPLELALLELAPTELAPTELGSTRAWQPGTINIVVAVPVPLSDAAFVNAIITATEAKSQAVIEAGFGGTGTASDAICIAAPAQGSTTQGGTAQRAPEDFAGPRSPWGARIARAVHAAVLTGATHYREKVGQEK